MMVSDGTADPFGRSLAGRTADPFGRSLASNVPAAIGQADPLGRSLPSILLLVGPLLAALLITGSVWPISSRSVRPFLDTAPPRRCVARRPCLTNASHRA